MAEPKHDEMYYLTVHSGSSKDGPSATTMEGHIKAYAKEKLDEQNKIHCTTCVSKQLVELTCNYVKLPEVCVLMVNT
jgi:hypothetical protein